MSVRRQAAVALAIVLAPPLIYLPLALVLSAIPVNRDVPPPENGIEIFLRSNGVHVEIVVPAKSAAIDWSADFPASDMRALAQPLAWISFGWGDRDFFLTTPTWRDLRAATAFSALAGLGSGALHVEYLDDPRRYRSRAIRIDEMQLRGLIDYLRATARRDASGRPIRIDAPGYFDADAFYEAVPVYTFWFTCNEWVRRGLAQAGIRTVFWAPFAQSLVD